jgi:hypothetical protein
MSSYICVIECSDNYVYVGDTRRLLLEDLSPEHIIGLYNVEQNYALYKIKNQPVSRHLDTLDADLDIPQSKIVETILADRWFRDKKNQKGNEWYKVRTGDLKQNSWMESVVTGYKKQGLNGGYYASHRVSGLKDKEVDPRPVCEHGYPCEIHFSKLSQELYFDCPLKYIWPNFMPELERIRPCHFKQVQQ